MQHYWRLFLSCPFHNVHVMQAPLHYSLCTFISSTALSSDLLSWHVVLFLESNWMCSRYCSFYPITCMSNMVISCRQTTQVARQYHGVYQLYGWIIYLGHHDSRSSSTAATRSTSFSFSQWQWTHTSNTTNGDSHIIMCIDVCILHFAQCITCGQRCNENIGSKQDSLWRVLLVYCYLPVRH